MKVLDKDNDLVNARSSVLDRLSNGEAVSRDELSVIDQVSMTQSNEFTKGLRRAGYSTLGSIEASIGQFIEPVAPITGGAIIDDARRQVQSMSPNLRPLVESYDQVKDLRSFGNYALSKLGEGGPSIGAALAGSLVGRGFAGVLGRNAAKGGLAGSVATMLPMETGETAMSLRDDPTAMANTTPMERALLAFGKGSINSALESYVPNMVVAPRLLGQAQRIGPGFGNALRNTALAAAEGGIGEFATEAAQELTGQVAQNIANPNAGYDTKALIEAGLSGMLPGAALGTAGGVAQGVYSNLPNLPKFGRGESETLKTKLDKFILDRVPEEHAEKFMEAASYLDGFTATHRKALGDAIADGDWRAVLEALVTGLTGQDTTENAGDVAAAAGTWTKSFIDAARSAISERLKRNKGAEPEAGKASLDRGYTDDDRIELLQSLYEAAPSLRETTRTMSAKDKREFADYMLTLADDPSFLQAQAGQQTPLGAVLEAWKSETGTDLGELLGQFRAKATADKTEALTAGTLERLIKDNAIPQEKSDLFQSALMTSNYEDLTPEQRWLLTQSALRDTDLSKVTLLERKFGKSFEEMSPLERLQTANLAEKFYGRTLRKQYETLRDRFDSRLNASEAQQPRMRGAMDMLSEQREAARKLALNEETLSTRDQFGVEGSDVDTYLNNEDLESGADNEGLVSSDARGNTYIEGQVASSTSEKEERSPFDLDAFKESMSLAGGYEANFNQVIPVRLKTDDTRVTPEMLAAVLGRKQLSPGGPGQKRVPEYHPATSMDVQRRVDKETGEVRAYINHKSAGHVVGEGRHRDRFAPFVNAYGDDTSSHIRVASRGAAALDILGQRGIDIHPSAFGLEGNDPIHVTVTGAAYPLVNKATRDGTKKVTNPNFMLGRETTTDSLTGKKVTYDVTARDLEGGFDRAAGLESQYKLISWLRGRENPEINDGFDGAYQTLTKNMANPRFREMRRRVDEQILRKGRSVEQLTPQERDFEVSQYAEKIERRITSINVQEKLNDEIKLLRSFYQNGDISRDDIETIIQLYELDGPLTEIEQLSGKTPKPGEKEVIDARLQELKDYVQTTVQDHRALLRRNDAVGRRPIWPNTSNEQTRQRAARQATRLRDMLEEVDQSKASYDTGIERKELTETGDQAFESDRRTDVARSNTYAVGTKNIKNTTATRAKTLEEKLTQSIGQAKNKPTDRFGAAHLNAIAWQLQQLESELSPESLENLRGLIRAQRIALSGREESSAPMPGDPIRRGTTFLQPPSFSQTTAPTTAEPDRNSLDAEMNDFIESFPRLKNTERREFTKSLEKRLAQAKMAKDASAVAALQKAIDVTIDMRAAVTSHNGMQRHIDRLKAARDQSTSETEREALSNRITRLERTQTGRANEPQSAVGEPSETLFQAQPDLFVEPIKQHLEGLKRELAALGQPKASATLQQRIDQALLRSSLQERIDSVSKAIRPSETDAQGARSKGKARQRPTNETREETDRPEEKDYPKGSAQDEIKNEINRRLSAAATNSVKGTAKPVNTSAVEALRKVLRNPDAAAVERQLVEAGSGPLMAARKQFLKNNPAMRKLEAERAKEKAALGAKSKRREDPRLVRRRLANAVKAIDSPEAWRAVVKEIAAANLTEKAKNKLRRALEAKRDELKDAAKAKPEEVKPEIKPAPAKVDRGLMHDFRVRILRANTEGALTVVSKQINDAKDKLTPEELSMLRQDFKYRRDDILGMKSAAKTSKPSTPFTHARTAKDGYEVSSKGDKRFSALTARLQDGRTIEEAFEELAKPSKPTGRTGKQSVDNPTPEEQKAEDGKPRSTDELLKEFREIVQKLLGNRVTIISDKSLTDSRGEYETREAALERFGNERRWALRQLKLPVDERAKKGNGAPYSDTELRSIAREAKRHQDRIAADKAILGIIRVAVGGEQQAGLAEHEAFHGAFAFFFSEEERAVLGRVFSRGIINRRLRNIFAGQPAVLEILDPTSEKFNAEEAAAYGFQIWMSNPDSLKLGEKAQNMFQRFKEFLRKLFNILTDEQKAELLLNELKSGKRAERGTAPAQKVLAKDLPMKERAQEFAKKIGELILSAYRVALASTHSRIVAKGNPVLSRIADLVYSPQGAEGNTGGMVQRARANLRLRINQANRIFQPLSEAQQLALHNAMIFQTKPEKIEDKAVATAVKQLRALFEQLYKYQETAGVDIAYRENYYPLQWSSEKVLKNQEAFIAMLEKPEYKAKMDKLMKTPLEVWKGIVAYLERGDELVDVMGDNNEPVSEHVRRTTLGFLSLEDRRAFMDDEPIHAVAHYIKQAVRNAEYVRVFGMQGKNLKIMLDEAERTYGATKDDRRLIEDFLDGALGNKEIGMSRELKDLYGAMTVYQNYRLLPLSVFSSLIDPMGIAIRSNSIGDAWEAFAYSMKNLFKEWKEQYDRDQWEMIAEDFGIIEDAGTTMNAHNMYDGITLRGFTKNLNDKLFKYNLLNGWIRNNTIMAVKAGQRFIFRAAEGKVFGKDSARYLEELGLEKGDVMFSEKLGRLALRKKEFMDLGVPSERAAELERKLRNAMDKFVRQALLNPSSAEMPNWMSNPYMMPIAHLKQFVFAFNATITKRLAHELEHGNYKPLMMAAAYVPGMIAADFLKDMIGNFGEEPPYKKDWGVVDYAWQGFQRSGFTGTGQFFLGAKDDIIHGGHGFESASGPSIEQLQKLVRAGTSSEDGTMYKWMVQSMPLMPLYDQALLD